QLTVTHSPSLHDALPILRLHLVGGAGRQHPGVDAEERRPEARERRPLPRHPALPWRYPRRAGPVPRLRRPRAAYRAPAEEARPRLTCCTKTPPPGGVFFCAPVFHNRCG